MGKIGAHVSIAGGLYRSIQNAEAIGAQTFQIFGASSRTWKTKQPASGDVKKYKETLKKSQLGPVFLHAPYLINLAGPDREIREKSVKNLAEHLKIAQLLDTDGLVLHVGSGKGRPREEAIADVVKGLRQVFKNVPGKTRLIMENAAGGKDKIGSRPEDFIEILHRIKSDRLKVCFDTAHALEAGWLEAYTPSKIKALFDGLDRDLGVENIVVLHANDSLTPYNSHHDRHENIGEGYIGMSGFKFLAREKRVGDLPWILEVPGFALDGPDKKNINRLKSCFK